jgi:hypothetical protein
VCPTFYEGWGLPIGESLALGKICVCSDRASVPEVAGDFGVYIDIDNFETSLAIIRDLIANEAKRKRLETKIRRGYKPITWRSVAERVVKACLSASQIKWREPYPFTVVPYSSEISFSRLDRNIDGVGELLLTRITGPRRGVFLSDALKNQAFRRGEEMRSGGYWAYPEEWGTWACHSGGELTMALLPNESTVYYVGLRVRTSGSVGQQPVRITANSDLVWDGSIGPQPRNLVVRVHRGPTNAAGGWRLRLRLQIDLPSELTSQLAAVDARMPTIGFERLIVVPDNDLKARCDILSTLLLL